MSLKLNATLFSIVADFKIINFLLPFQSVLKFSPFDAAVTTFSWGVVYHISKILKPASGNTVTLYMNRATSVILVMTTNCNAS